MRMFLNSLLVVLLAACTTPPTNDTGGGGGASVIELSVDRARYQPGDPIVLTLSNRTQQRIGYNLCAAALDRRSGGEWREAPERPAEVCTMELRTLDPGGADTYRHTLPAGLTPGEYRLRTNVESPLGGGSTTVSSAAFQVSA